MNGGGYGRGRAPTRGAAFLVFHLFGMKIKALFTMILFQNNLISTASSITFTLKMG